MKQYTYLIRRLSDGCITHKISSDDASLNVQIPRGWDLENNNEVIKVDSIEKSLEKMRKEKKLKRLTQSEIDRMSLDQLKVIVLDLIDLLIDRDDDIQ